MNLIIARFVLAFKYKIVFTNINIFLQSPSQQFYHTEAKPYACLHPMGYFANNPQMLQLNEPDILEKTGTYKSKLPLSSRHQLLCYLYVY